MQKTASSQRNSVRIIAGEFRSRKLAFPGLDGLRPTADRTRETLFNWLQDNIQGESCLDMFSGSGALGFEALSRGARQVDFVEKNTMAANCIKRNLEQLNIVNGRLYCDDAFHWLQAQQKDGPRYGVVFLDPPFHDDFIAAICSKLQASGLLKKSCLLYVESGNIAELEKIPSTWKLLKRKKTGTGSYNLYEAGSSN